MSIVRFLSVTFVVLVAEDCSLAELAPNAALRQILDHPTNARGLARPKAEKIEESCVFAATIGPDEVVEGVGEVLQRAFRVSLPCAIDVDLECIKIIYVVRKTRNSETNLKRIKKINVCGT